MLKQIIEDKRFLTIYMVVVFSLVLAITYALNANGIGLNVATALIGVDARVYGSTTFDSTNLDFKPILDSELDTSLDNIIKLDFTVGGASTNTANNVIYDIALSNLDIDCNLLSPYIKWKLIKDGTELSSGSLDYKFDTIKNGRLVLTNTQEDLPDYSADKTGYHSYTFYMWFSDSCQDSDITKCIGKIDQSSLVGKYFSGRIEVELYTDSKKALVRSPSDKLNTSTCSNNNSSVMVNKPNLDNGNLIPVYYDDVDEVWKKADSDNKNYSWYNYENKRWANAVIIGDSTKKSTYQDSEPGTIIDDSDITAFYVWIPRYKYRVWNITRQGGDESTYAYKAFSKGIDIVFENGTASTGNVVCTYDTSVAESETTLSDSCKYNGSSTAITTTDSNKNYTNAWYTHPAFTFGGNPIEGFWIGKFETSTDTSSTCYTESSTDNCNNTNQNPRILPDVSSLRFQNISNQFTTSKKFQTYLSSNIDAHMLTNLEWGAVAYLTHSIYGLCNDNSCKGVNHNNSSGYYTGRSMGNIATSLTTSTYGSYNYKGYKLSNNNETEEKNITKVASTTGNITGVYDMSGGAYEYVMGNMVDSSNNFYPSSAVLSEVTNPWNGNSTLDSKYYNAYSYGTNSYNAIAFNRARLGDATAEVLGGISDTSSWQPESGITGSISYFVSSSLSWFDRGGHYSGANSGTFYFNINNGGSFDNVSFRSSLS